MDYLFGTDHIACLLKTHTPKIQNWNKLDGQKFDVMGVSLYLTDAASTTNQSDIYTVWVYENILGSKEALMRINLFLDTMEIDIKTFIPSTFSSPPFHTNKKITKDHIKSPSIFIQTIGQMMMSDPNIRKVLDFLAEMGNITTARGGMTGGIVGKVMSAGTSVTYSMAPSSHSYSPGPGINGSSGNLW
jgi:hypothetical protein